MVLRPKKEEDLTKRYIKPGEYRELTEPEEPSKFLEEPEEYEEKPKEKIVKIRERERMPRTEDEKIESLQRVAPKIIGNIFDRVRFLEERISEIKSAIEERKSVHAEIMSELAADVTERKEMLRRLSELSDKRDFMLDISLLQREKRKENVQFWRDVLELTTELRELTEEHQMEAKIASIFSSIELKS